MREGMTTETAIMVMQIAVEELAWEDKDAIDSTLMAMMFLSHTRQAIENYIIDGYQPGGFLTAVFANDLFGAMGSADHLNKFAMAEICGWIYNEAPRDCWGNYQVVKDYLDMKRKELEEKMEKDNPLIGAITRFRSLTRTLR
jgi:hypothetical protein